MVNHPNRSKPFRVAPMFGASEEPHELHIVVQGRGIDDTFDQGRRLAHFIEAALNAAFRAFDNNTRED